MVETATLEAPGFVDDFSRENEDAERLLMRPGLTVFVGKRQQRGRSVVMAGASDVPWFRAVCCVGANHAARAAAVVARYRAK